MAFLCRGSPSELFFVLFCSLSPTTPEGKLGVGEVRARILHGSSVAVAYIVVGDYFEHFSAVHHIVHTPVEFFEITPPVSCEGGDGESTLAAQLGC